MVVDFFFISNDSAEEKLFCGILNVSYPQMPCSFYPALCHNSYLSCCDLFLECSGVTIELSDYKALNGAPALYLHIYDIAMIYDFCMIYDMILTKPELQHHSSQERLPSAQHGHNEVTGDTSIHRGSASCQAVC